MCIVSNIKSVLICGGRINFAANKYGPNQLLMTDESSVFCCDLKSSFQSLKNNQAVSAFIAFSREHFTNAEHRKKNTMGGQSL